MTQLLEPVELRSRGFEALVHSLGWVNAVRFIHQFERGAFTITPPSGTLCCRPWNAEELVRQMNDGEK